MEVQGYLQILCCGLFGGFVAELAKWYRLRTKGKLPTYIRSPFYWFVTVLMILSGGVLTVLYGKQPMSTIMAVNLGMSAPLLIQSIASTSNTATAEEECSLSLNTKNSQDLIGSYYKKQKQSLIEFIAG